MKKLLLVLLIAGSAAAQTEKSREALGEAGLERKTLGKTVYWTNTSKAAPLVLLHGANDQAGTWAAVAPLLSKDYRLIIPDLAGHGESEPKTGPITYAAMLAELKALVDHEVPEGKVTLAGNSMGGWMAMLYALENPKRVERLVLENASGMTWLLTVPLMPKTREEAAAVMRAVWGPDADTSEATLDALLARKDLPMSRISFLDALTYLVDKRLSELTMPVALIWGRHDGVLPLEYARALQEKIPGSTLSIIDDAAHIPHRQRPREFVRHLRSAK